MPEPPMMPRTALVISAPSPVITTSKAAAPAAASSAGSALRMQFDRVPDLFLGEIHQSREHDQENHDLEADALARVELRLSRPHQERGNILGILLDGCRRTIVVGDVAILNGWRHLDGVAGEVPVVECPLGDRFALRRSFLIALEQRGEI